MKFRFFSVWEESNALTKLGKQTNCHEHGHSEFRICIVVGRPSSDEIYRKFIVESKVLDMHLFVIFLCICSTQHRVRGINDETPLLPFIRIASLNLSSYCHWRKKKSVYNYSHQLLNCVQLFNGHKRKNPLLSLTIPTNERRT